MTIRHMEILKTIAETGSFTKAARVLYITQSAISHAVRELEEESGTVLFDRLSKSVRLTEAGSLLLRETLPVLAACNALEKRMRHLEQHAPVHLVSSITIATYYLPCALQSFSLTHPDISISVDVVSAANALLVLQAGEADFALIEGLPPQGPYVSIPFSSYPLKAVCSPGYRCSKQPLTLSALCQEKLLLREKGSAIRDALDSALYLHGLTAHPAWTSVNSPALIEAAKAGLGIAVLPDILVENALDKGELTVLDITDMELINQLLLVFHKDKYLSGPLTTLMQCITQKQAEKKHPVTDA